MHFFLKGRSTSGTSIVSHSYSSEFLWIERKQFDIYPVEEYDHPSFLQSLVLTRRGNGIRAVKKSSVYAGTVQA